MSYGDIAWIPLTVGLTVLGLILSYFAYRRRGVRPAMMGAAWSLLPVAAYMTGATEMLWKVGTAIEQFASGFVFSPMKWAGVGVTGLAIALFLAAGGRSRRKASREARKAARGEDRKAAGGDATTAALGAPKAGTQVLPTQRQQVPVERSSGKSGGKSGGKAADDQDDLKDIEDILRKHGI